MALLRDLRHAFRTLSQSPGYALTCIAVLALGIGANAAIFSVVHSVIVKSLPFPEVDRLVFVWEKFPGASGPMFERSQVRPKNYREWFADQGRAADHDEIAAERYLVRRQEFGAHRNWTDEQIRR